MSRTRADSSPNERSVSFLLTEEGRERAAEGVPGGSATSAGGEKACGCDGGAAEWWSGCVSPVAAGPERSRKRSNGSAASSGAPLVEVGSIPAGGGEPAESGECASGEGREGDEAAAASARCAACSASLCGASGEDASTAGGGGSVFAVPSVASSSAASLILPSPVLSSARQRQSASSSVTVKPSD
eukprot:scaffold66118_cov20-Tisochrysis_lutea.AAC.4